MVAFTAPPQGIRLALLPPLATLFNKIEAVTST